MMATRCSEFDTHVLEGYKHLFTQLPRSNSYIWLQSNNYWFQKNLADHKNNSILACPKTMSGTKPETCIGRFPKEEFSILSSWILWVMKTRSAFSSIINLWMRKDLILERYVISEQQPELLGSRELEFWFHTWEQRTGKRDFMKIPKSPFLSMICSLLPYLPGPFSYQPVFPSSLGKFQTKEHRNFQQNQSFGLI